MSKSNKNSHHLVLFTHKPLDLLQGIRFVSSPKCGAINTFLGTIRDHDVDLDEYGKEGSDNLKPIVGIFYEAYEAMAKQQINNIVESVIDSNSNLLAGNSTDEFVVDYNCKIYVAVRLGRVNVSESSIAICVSSTGRHYSHKATMFILEKIKSMVTIWKKVIYADGTERWGDEAKSEACWLK